jgi:threonine dehydratase
MVAFEQVRKAYDQIRTYIRQTPLSFDTELGWYLKWESHQETGSFKVRGALHKILDLPETDTHRALVTASAGNHGQGVALTGKIVGRTVHVFASEHAAPIKIKKMKEFGAHVHLVPGGYVQAEQAAIHYAAETMSTWVSPYNDPAIVAGQGTLALEILNQVTDIPPSTWFVPVGGGGLISGIAVVLRKLLPQARIIGVQSEASPFFHALFHGQSQESVIELPSLADGLAGAVETGSITIPLVNQLVDEIALVSEAEIVDAIKFACQRYGEIIEGSAAAALAAAQSAHQSGKIPTPQDPGLPFPWMIILSGGNIQPELHTQITVA